MPSKSCGKKSFFIFSTICTSNMLKREEEERNKGGSNKKHRLNICLVSQDLKEKTA